MASSEMAIGRRASRRVVLWLRPCKTSPIIRTGRIIESLIQVRARAKQY
jgi:hypothetical protein